MKRRNGFVSNSSSSSFIVGFKGENNLKEKLMEGIEKNPLKPIIEKMVDCIVEKVTIYKDKKSFIESEFDVIDEIDDRELKESYPTIHNLFDKGFVVGYGYFSDDEYGLESALCYSDLHINDEDFFVEHDGGY